MKTFTVSSIIFLLLIAIIAINASYINRTADRLDALVDEISEDIADSGDIISELQSFWEKNITKIEFTVSHAMVNSIGLKIAGLRHHYEAKDFLQFSKELLLLKEEIKEFRRPERVSTENLF